MTTLVFIYCLRFPANIGQCINIGAVAKKDNLPTARRTNTNDGVDYCGIGVDVVSFRPDGTFQGMSGTWNEYGMSTRLWFHHEEG